MKKTMKKTTQLAVFLLNCTWGILQTLIGFIGFLIFIRKEHYWYKGGVVTVIPGGWGGISLGAFIFVGANVPKRRAPASDLVNHEYGHCLQSILLGPFYLLVIGLPSIIWAGCFNDWRKKHNKSYYWLYCERWADKWGGVKRI